MTRKFINKVKLYGVVDTRKYRYLYNYDNGCIMRLPIRYLDTTKAIDSWTIVKQF